MRIMHVFALAAICWHLPAVGHAKSSCVEIQDTAEAIISPDKYAWRLFVALNQPGDPATRCVDTSKKFGDDGPALWETWRNGRRGSSDTVYPAKGKDPGEWLSVPVASLKTQEDFGQSLRKSLVLATQLAVDPNGMGVAFDPFVGESNEVRINKPAFEFIRANKLYNKGEQKKLAASGKEILQFPADAKLVKAVWRKIKPTEKSRYHWASVRLESGDIETWGLTGLHITTKDLPNWFWATFEHIDNKVADAGPLGGGSPNEGWKTTSSDRHACPTAPYDCELIPAGMGIEGTVWENYRLRGTQIDFVTTFGVPTILANSHIEKGFQRRSSCLTCHALATIDKDGTRIGFSIVIGVPDPNVFLDPITRQRRYMQNDFVFSLDHASE